MHIVTKQLDRNIKNMHVNLNFSLMIKSEVMVMRTKLGNLGLLRKKKKNLIKKLFEEPVRRE